MYGGRVFTGGGEPIYRGPIDVIGAYRANGIAVIGFREELPPRESNPGERFNLTSSYRSPLLLSYALSITPHLVINPRPSVVARTCPVCLGMRPYGSGYTMSRGTDRIRTRASPNPLAATR